MVENGRNKTYAVTAAVIFIILSVINLADFIRWVHFNDLIMCGGNILLAVGLLGKDREKLIPLGSLLLLAVEIIVFFENFYYSNYDIWDYYYTHFNFFCMIPNLIKLVAVFCMAAILIAIFTDKLDNYKNEIMKFWFLPLILRGVALGVALLVVLGSNGNWVYSYGWISFRNFFVEAATIVAFIFIVMWPGVLDLAKQSAGYTQGSYAGENYGGPYSENAYGNNFAQGMQQGKDYQSFGWIESGYIGMLKHVLLLIFTFGIWNMIWIYKVTRYLNGVKTAPERNPVAQLLLCIFVPFYLIYWIYETSKRIDMLAQQNGVSSEITLISTLFAIFFYIFAPIFMQDKINEVVRVRADRARFRREENQGASYYQYTETSSQGEEGAYNSSSENTESEDQPSYQGYRYSQENPKDSDDNSSSEMSQNRGAESEAETAKPAADSENTYAYEERPSEKSIKSASEIADELKIYKDLLDREIITQEEFDAKKKSLLGL